MMLTVDNIFILFCDLASRNYNTLILLLKSRNDNKIHLFSTKMSHKYKIIMLDVLKKGINSLAVTL
jgi:hypothetical protein